MVRSEVVRILDRGPGSNVEAPSRPESLEELLLGYDETSLDPIGPAPNRPLATDSNDTRQAPPAPVRILQATDDDDWSFEDPESVAPQEVVAPGTSPEQPVEETEPARSRLRPLLVLAALVALSFIIAFVVVRRVESRQ